MRPQENRANEPFAPFESDPRSVIESVRVEDLFGKFSYEIPPERTTSAGRLLILYGDNGSGKTTLLRLIYHLLSPALGRGHRSFIARTPFTALELRLRDGTTISVQKEEPRGPFTVVADVDGSEVVSAHFAVDERGKVPAARNPEEMLAHERYSEFLESLNLVPYYLADDRVVYSDNLDEDSDDDPRDFWVEERISRGRLIRRRSRPEGASDLERALRQATEWFRRQLFTASRSGSANANSIYLDVVRRLAMYSVGPDESSSDASVVRQSLHEKLSALLARNAKFEEFGLSAPFAGDELLRLLNQTPVSRVELLDEVLTPYLEGLDARLNAIDPLEQLLRTFVETVNGFLSWKSLTFSLADGLQIWTDEGVQLAPTVVSSGERQLLLLLCSVLTARDETRLFLVDEPEISLNVKWQRRLLDALLTCSVHADMQFIIATHSIEVITGHQESLARLVSTN